MPAGSTASAIRPSMASTTSTAVTVAGKTPVCPTMSGFAKFTTRKRYRLLRTWSSSSAGTGRAPGERLVGKGDLGRESFLVLGERHEVRELGPVPALKLVAGLIEDGMAQLPGPVRTEVRSEERR